MANSHLAQGLASLGRNGDSMLVHMQPREVAGLQALAMSHGGSLSINPETGLPEAGFLGDVLGAVAPIAIGGLLSMTGLSPLAAGLLTGAATWAVTGDPLQGLMGGLGSFGGAGLADDLAKFGAGSVSKVPTTALVGQGAASSIPGTTGVGAFTSLADDAVAAGANAASSAATAASSTPTLQSIGAGASKALSSPGQFVKDYGWGNVATVATPLLAGATANPQMPLMTATPMNYEGPYRPEPRERRMPTSEEQLQLAAAGSPEFSYFSPSNPSPGYLPYAEGGSISSGGIQDLYGSPDDQLRGMQLSQDGYGLGRLQSMYGGGIAEYAGGGPISFDAGGQIPTIGATPSVPEFGGSSNVGIPSGLDTALANAISDPMGRMNPSGQALGAGDNGYMNQITGGVTGAGDNGYMARITGGITGAGPGGNLNIAPPTPMPVEPDFSPLGNRTMLNPGVSPTGIEQQYFDQVNPQPIQAAQGGIMSLARGGRPTPGGYLDGPGDGMSDSIPATIAGKQPARLADGEFVVPADVVSHLGNGSTKAGAKHLYKMMDRVRQARTGTKKQGRQINPGKFLKA